MASGSRYRFTLLGTKTFRFREMWTAVELVEASRCTCTSALKRAVVGPAEKGSLSLSLSQARAYEVTDRPDPTAHLHRTLHRMLVVTL